VPFRVQRLLRHSSEVGFDATRQYREWAAFGTGSRLKASPTSRIPTEAAIAPKSGSPGFDMLIASGSKERKRR
jgi:hypothetical protein